MMGYRVCLLVFLGVLDCVYGHGRLIDPPSRSSMWKFGFPTLPNYNDNQLNCGGYSDEWGSNHGKCGICGDPYEQPSPRDNEAGGKYGKGIIVQTYHENDIIDVKVEITANHRGWFEFKICPNNDPSRVATQACLDQYLLQKADGSGTRYDLGINTGIMTIKLKLPQGLMCSQCVFQWRWHAGNNWGVDSNGHGCVGCGKAQEEFFGCADVTILGSNGNTSTRQTSRPQTSKPQTPVHNFTRDHTPPPVATQKATNPQTRSPAQTPKPVTIKPPTNGQGCHAVNLWAGIPRFDQYCITNCAAGYCPALYCKC